ncbi:hypothetical protein REPUB_Repub08aG0207700 [Reevesia pubescens]
MEKIDHFLHSHPLILTEGEEVNDKFVCLGCRKGLWGPIYGCYECDFYLHKSCSDSELPKEIHSYIHPCPLLLNIVTNSTTSCDACFERVNGFSYRCQGCNFDMHVECAERPTNEPQGEELHFTHWHHPLTLLVDQNKHDLEVLCSICQKKLCSDSDPGSAYGCEECKFFLHKSCMLNIPQRIFNHSFHPSCPLILLPTSSDKCSACDERGSGLVFRCGKCRFQLDVKCALLPTIESEAAHNKIQHLAHRHPLALHETREFGSEKVGCRVCGENCLGSCFCCEKCDFFVHTQCLVELPLEMRHPFHPLHALTLSPHHDDTFQCLACLGGDDRLMRVYRCAKCDSNFHINCANPKLTPVLTKYEGHSHHLTFFDKIRGYSPCSICLEEAKNCIFRCVSCEYNIHLCCHPSTPKTIKHKCHLHPLTLRKSPFKFELNRPEDGYNSDDDFYCDVCEEKRYKSDRVYYCEECKFIAEVCCVISELLPSLTISEDQSTVNSRVISTDEENLAMEDTVVKLNNEIAELKEKKKPLKVEVEKFRATLKTLEEELEQITFRRRDLKTTCFLNKYQLNQNMKENKYRTEASTSEQQAADLS